MHIEEIKTIRGPNVFHHKPVLVMCLRLEELAEVSSADLAGFVELLTGYLPGLNMHRCSPGRPGGFIERLQRGTYFAHIVEHIALELSTAAGIEVGYGKSSYGGKPGLYKVAVRYRCEEGMKFLLEVAVELAQAAVEKRKDYPLTEKIEQAKKIVAHNQLGPSTEAIVRAAERRGIPWQRLNDMSLIQLGWGTHRKLIQATTSGATSDIAVDIAQDKLTKKFLSNAAIRVPEGHTVSSEREAIEVFEKLGGPVAVKPVDGHQGRGVSLNLSSPSEVLTAYHIACKYSDKVVVEEYLSGKDYRVLVVNGKMVAASERLPAHVIGDGRHTIAELIEIENTFNFQCYFSRFE